MPVDLRHAQNHSKPNRSKTLMGPDPFGRSHKQTP